MYEGPFVEDKKVGHGHFYFSDGRVYEGDFIDDKMEGMGKITYKV